MANDGYKQYHADRVNDSTQYKGSTGFYKLHGADIAIVEGKHANIYALDCSTAEADAGESVCCKMLR